MKKYISKKNRELYADRNGRPPHQAASNAELLEAHLKLDLDELETPKIPEKEPPISDISVDKLIGKGLIILDREVRNLMGLSSTGKLDPNNARDLRDTVKLLFELKEREAKALGALSDQELEEQAKKALHDGK